MFQDSQGDTVRPCLNTPSLSPRKSLCPIQVCHSWITLSCFCCYLQCVKQLRQRALSQQGMWFSEPSKPLKLCCAQLSSLKLIQSSFVISKFKLSELSSLRLGQDCHVFKARECGRKVICMSSPFPHFFMVETESHRVFGCCPGAGIKGLCYHAHPYLFIYCGYNCFLFLFLTSFPSCF